MIFTSGFLLSAALVGNNRSHSISIFRMRSRIPSNLTLIWVISVRRMKVQLENGLNNTDSGAEKEAVRYWALDSYDHIIVNPAHEDTIA